MSDQKRHVTLADVGEWEIQAAKHQTLSRIPLCDAFIAGCAIHFEGLLKNQDILSLSGKAWL